METTVCGTSASVEQDFLEQYPLMKRVIRAVCRRQRLSHIEESEFSGSVFLKLIDNDYSVFRRCRAQTALQPFLFTVVQNHLLDWRNREWGKWRPSVRARQLGSAAVYLEQLVTRDGLQLSEAAATLRSHPRWRLESADFHHLYEQLAPRVRRNRHVKGGDPLELPFLGTPLTELELNDLRSCARQARSALRAALHGLDAEDRRLLRLRFREGLTVTAIAEKLNVDAKALYRRFDRILKRLRAAVEERDLTSSVARALLDRSGVELPAFFNDSAPGAAV